MLGRTILRVPKPEHRCGRWNMGRYDQHSEAGVGVLGVPGAAAWQDR